MSSCDRDYDLLNRLIRSVSGPEWFHERRVDEVQNIFLPHFDSTVGCGEAPVPILRVISKSRIDLGLSAVGLRDLAQHIRRLDTEVVVRLQDEHGPFCIPYRIFQTFSEHSIAPGFRAWRKGNESLCTKSFFCSEESLNASKGASRNDNAICIDFFWARSQVIAATTSSFATSCDCTAAGSPRLP